MKNAIATVVLLVCSLSVPIVAQESASENVAIDRGEPSTFVEPTNAEILAAQGLMDEGAKLYSEGKFSEAAVVFQKAYAIVPAASFMYNAAFAAQRAGNLDQAMSLIQKAMGQEHLVLEEELRTRAEKMVVELEDAMAERDRKAAIAEARGLDWRGWTGVGLFTAGAIGIIVGPGVFGAQASETNVEASVETSKATYDRLVEDMERQQLIGQVTLYSGVALLLAGAGLFAWDLLEEPEVNIDAGVTTDGAQVRMGWSW